MFLVIPDINHTLVKVQEQGSTFVVFIHKATSFDWFAINPKI